MELNKRLEEIREMQGRSPLPSPHQIQGFGGPGDKPSPPPPANIPDEWLNPEDDDEPELPPSPLIPRRPVAPVVAKTPPQADMEFSDLTEEDLRQITEIMLKAKLRKLQAALASVAAPRKAPKRPQSLSAPNTPESVSVEPRKRGRPKKVTA